MSHRIQALIGRDPATTVIEKSWAHVTRVTLPFDLWIIPLSDELVREMTGRGFSWPDIEEYDDDASGLLKELDPIIAALQRLNLPDHVALIMTEYWGGTGLQAAILFDAEKIRFALLSEYGAINQVLREMGVTNDGKSYDEFEAVGLQHWRSNESITPSAN